MHLTVCTYAQVVVVNEYHAMILQTVLQKKYELCLLQC